MEAKLGSRAIPRSPASPPLKIEETVAKGVGRRVPFCRIMRTFPVFFSLKRMRPSGENLSETGKLRPVRTGVTGERVWTNGNIAEPDISMTAQSMKVAMKTLGVDG